MGTPAIIFILDENGRVITRLHVHRDGSPGRYLLHALRLIGERKLVYGAFTDYFRQSVGMLNFAAQLTWALVEAYRRFLKIFFRDAPDVVPAGNIYVLPQHLEECEDVYEYKYVFYPRGREVRVRVYECLRRHDCFCDCTRPDEDYPPDHDLTIAEYLERFSQDRDESDEA